MKKFLKYLLLTLVTILVILVGFTSALYFSADMGEPNIAIDTSAYKVIDYGSYKQCNNSKLRQNKSGLWELYTAGDALTRGAATGALTKELLKYQEDVFVTQIKNIIPSDSYLKFLRTLIVIFNRNMAKHISEEYRTEIYASAMYCTHEYDAIGTPYERQINYHAAHDIGHTMQQYMLVGCSSFAAWDKHSADSSLIIGRNFDFYVGDDFARNKLVTFCDPQNGYRFAGIGWAGMIGILSGMNEKGLTVTINAAKGGIPTSATTPISLLAREILQYASTIEEAYNIAATRNTFVSESILIGSAKDGRSAIIEKTPDKMVLYNSTSSLLLCTNHYQSNMFTNDEYNMDNIANSDSQYRFNRLKQLTQGEGAISVAGGARVLRDQKGIDGKDIGLANEMTINQSIAHHSVIFKPKELKMWVSTSPWQAGEYVCYDLNEVFAAKNFSTEIADSTLTIAADSSYLANSLEWVLKYRAGISKIKKAILGEEKLEASFIPYFENVNPNHYYTHKIIADYFLEQGDKPSALTHYTKALGCEIPYVSQRKEIEKSVEKLK